MLSEGRRSHIRSNIRVALLLGPSVTDQLAVPACCLTYRHAYVPQSRTGVSPESAVELDDVSARGLPAICVFPI